jgi:hypothetical protein
VRLGEELLTREPPSVMYNMRTANKYISTWTLRDGSQTISHHEVQCVVCRDISANSRVLHTFSVITACPFCPQYLEFRYVELVTVVPAQCALSTPADYTSQLTLSCPSSDVITAVEFASWGTPSGQCTGSGAQNSFAVNNSCEYPNSVAVVRDLCVGKTACAFVPNDTLFGGVDPCDKVEKWLAVAVLCANNSSHGALSVATPSVQAMDWASSVNVSAWQLFYPAAYIQNQVSVLVA